MPATQQKAPKEKVRKLGKCPLCGKYIKRGFTVHMKGHQDYKNWDYNCKFKVLGKCKTYKNTLSSPAHCLFHMFTQHFKFDDYKVPRSPNIDELLKHTGECGCGYNDVAKDWLYDHVLTDECPLTKPGAVAPPPPQYKCSVCHRTFHRSKDWYKHFTAHRGSWDLNCKFRRLGKCGLYHGPSKIAHVCIEHMLNAHFKFDRIDKPSTHKYSQLLREFGRCKCGYHGLATTWVDEHVLGDQCPLIEELSESEAEEHHEA